MDGSPSVVKFRRRESSGDPYDVVLTSSTVAIFAHGGEGGSSLLYHEEHTAAAVVDFHSSSGFNGASSLISWREQMKLLHARRLTNRHTCAPLNHMRIFV